MPASALVIPLDTHIGRIARHLGLTRRKDLTWRTAEEVTASLRRLDEADPVRYDFALCHYGMSGVCPAKPVAENCAKCLLLPSCAVGPRLTRSRTSSSAP
jgi:endonuclease III